MIFVDTNYFIRYLVDDIPSQHKIVKDLFLKGSKGEHELFTSTVVMFEIYWVFTDFYKKTKEEIIQILIDVLAMDFIKIEEREIIIEAVGIYTNTTVELEDCYNLSYAKANKMTEFVTFDKKLTKIVDR